MERKSSKRAYEVLQELRLEEQKRLDERKSSCNSVEVTTEKINNYLNNCDDNQLYLELYYKLQPNVNEDCKEEAEIKLNRVKSIRDSCFKKRKVSIENIEEKSYEGIGNPNRERLNMLMHSSRHVNYYDDDMVEYLRTSSIELSRGATFLQYKPDIYQLASPMHWEAGNCVLIGAYDTGILSREEVSILQERLIKIHGLKKGGRRSCGGLLLTQLMPIIDAKYGSKGKITYVYMNGSKRTKDIDLYNLLLDKLQVGFSTLITYRIKNIHHSVVAIARENYTGIGEPPKKEIYIIDRQFQYGVATEPEAFMNYFGKKIRQFPTDTLYFSFILFRPFSSSDSGSINSPKRKSPKRNSPKRKSPKRNSPKRKSPKRKSPKRKSPKRKSPKRKSPKRKSPKRKSPKRR